MLLSWAEVGTVSHGYYLARVHGFRNVRSWKGAGSDPEMPAANTRSSVQTTCCHEYPFYEASLRLGKDWSKDLNYTRWSSAWTIEICTRQRCRADAWPCHGSSIGIAAELQISK